VIGVSPGAAFGTAKQWLPERFAEVAGRVALESGASVAIFGSQSERDLCETVAQAITVPVRNFAGQTSLGEFIDMAAACSLYLSNDSGAMHIASALGVPALPSLARRTTSLPDPRARWLEFCESPSSAARCMKRECPSTIAA